MPTSVCTQAWDLRHAHTVNARTRRDHRLGLEDSAEEAARRDRVREAGV